MSFSSTSISLTSSIGKRDLNKIIINTAKDKKHIINVFLESEIKFLCSHIFKTNKISIKFSNNIPVIPKQRLKYGVPSGLLLFIL